MNFAVPELFSDRREAGRLLGERLKHLSGENPLVIGLPRGGVIVAAEIADVLGAELDVIVPAKIGAPGNPELAVGAVMEDGSVYLNEDIVGWYGVDEEYIKRAVGFQMEKIRRRVEAYRKVKERVPVEGRCVILTDDGVATGATMKSAVKWASSRSPSRVVIALPVGPEDTIRELSSMADEVICLKVPPFFSAVSQFYIEFDQVGDEEVIEVLKGHS